jgi:hypothetical protein
MKLTFDTPGARDKVGLRIQNLLSSRTRSVKIVSPYVSSLDRFTMKSLGKHSDIKIICDIHSSGCDPFQIERLTKLYKKKISIKTNKWVHAKLYLTPSMAVLGSANFTGPGMGLTSNGNIESGIEIFSSNQLENRLIDEANKWFDFLWNHWSSRDIAELPPNELAELKARWKARNFSGKGAKAHFVDLFFARELSDAVFLFYTEDCKLSDKAVKQALKQSRKILPNPYEWIEEDEDEDSKRIKLSCKRYKRQVERFRNHVHIAIPFSEKNGMPSKVIKSVSLYKVYDFHVLTYKKKVFLISIVERLERAFSFTYSDRQKTAMFADWLTLGFKRNKQEWNAFLKKSYGVCTPDEITDILMKGVDLPKYK